MSMSKTLNQLRTLTIGREDAASDAKARADFFKKGGKITKLPPGRAHGSTGTDTHWASGVKGLVPTKGLNLKKHGKHLDTSTPVHKDDEQKEGLVKDRGPTGIAYAPNPIHMKDIGRMVKDPKYKGNTSGLMKAVKAKHPELHNHPNVQKAYQKHAETNESFLPEKNIEFNTGHNVNDVEQHAAHKKVVHAIHNAAKSNVTKWKSGYPKGGKMYGMVTAKRKDGVQSVINVIKKHIPKQHHSSIKVHEGHESTTIKSFDDIRKQYSPQTHEWGTETATRWAKAMTPGELVQSESVKVARAAAKDAHAKGMKRFDAHRHIQDKVAAHYRDREARSGKKFQQGAGSAVTRLKMDKDMESGENHFANLRTRQSKSNESTIHESTNWKGGSKHVGLARYAAKQGYGLQIHQEEPMPGQQKRFKGAYVSMPVKDIPKLIKALQNVYKAPANVQLGDAD